MSNQSCFTTDCF